MTSIFNFILNSATCHQYSLMFFNSLNANIFQYSVFLKEVQRNFKVGFIFLTFNTNLPIV